MKGKMDTKRLGALVGLTAWLTAGIAGGTSTVDFSDLTLDPDSYWHGSDNSGGFHSAGVFFANEYEFVADWNWESWKGFSYSNIDDTTTPGHGNQFAAFSGGGMDSDIYAIGYHSLAWAESPEYRPRLTLSIANTVVGLHVANTTYAALYMRDGDPVFGAEPFQQGDWLRLSIIGLDEFDGPLGTVTVDLADFRSDDPQDHFILSDWAFVSLEALGSDVKALEFAVDSSDLFAPTTFALDQIMVVPEPGTVLFLGVGGLVLMLLRRRTAGFQG